MQNNLYVTNPCFALFLLMHFDNFNKNIIDAISKEEKPNSYIFDLLSEFTNKKYIKSKLDFSFYINNLAKALKNSELVSNNLKDLKLQIGTNIPEFIYKFKKHE